MQESGKYWSKCEAQRRVGELPIVVCKVLFSYLFGGGGKSAYNLVVLCARVFKLLLMFT